MSIDQFLEYLRYERNYSSHTVLSYHKDLLQFRDFVLSECGEFSLSDVDSDLVRMWVVHLMESKMEASSVRRKISALKSFYRFLLKRGAVKKNPLINIISPKLSKKIPIFVKETEMDRLLDKGQFGDGFESVRNKAIINLFYSTGIRRAELLGLKDSDVDFEVSSLKVTGKRNKQRIIPLGDEIRSLLWAYLEERDARIGPGDGFLFVDENGDCLKPASVYKIVKSMLSASTTLAKTSPHVLRHSFATAMLNNGAKLNSVKELLGHSSLASTEIYTHTTFEELNKTYNSAHPRAENKKGG